MLGHVERGDVFDGEPVGFAGFGCPFWDVDVVALEVGVDGLD